MTSEARMYGYARVSSREQHEDRQIAALTAFGVESGRIYLDKQSGKDFNRVQYLRLSQRLRQGDVLVVKSIDRLGRNYEEILEQWRFITKSRRADIVVLDMPLLDNRQGRDLTGMLIADIVLQLLSYVAQTEREFIRQRQQEGIVLAQARGVHFGPKPRQRPENYAACVTDFRQGTCSAREAGRRLGVDHKTFQRWVRSDERLSSSGTPRLN